MFGVVVVDVDVVVVVVVDVVVELGDVAVVGLVLVIPLSGQLLRDTPESFGMLCLLT